MDNLVSIIMPVYNTVEYLDESVGSLVNQTYSNIEIVIVDDESTDGSYEKVMDFAKKDKRINVYRVKHGGLGPARNYGIKVANGEWIAFIDSDDWYDLNYVDIMLRTALNEKADLVTCNLCKVQYSTGERQPMNCSEVIGISLSHDRKLIKDIQGVVTKFSRKKLWTKYDIEQPASRSQDFAVVLLLEAVAEKMICINDELYFYRKSRPNAISTGNTTNRKEVVISAKCLVDGFRRNGIYKEYKDILYRHVARQFSLILSSGYSNMNEIEYFELKKIFTEFMNTEFNANEVLNLFHIGSFNLMRTIREMPFIQDTSMSYQFSSIISIVNPYEKDIVVNHNNKFRKKMIEKDIKGEFWRRVNECDYLILDFIEERHGVIKVGDSYCTNSDALAQMDTIINGDIIEFGTDEWKKLWIKSIKQFIKRLSNIISINKIIVVKNILATEYGNVNKLNDYKGLETIVSINQVLNWCYEVIEKEYPEIALIDIDGCKYYFTDGNYEYGVYPWHLNDIVNEEIADKIYEKIVNNK